MRYQFVLDKLGKKVLDDLAQYRGGNRSRVALVTLADMEARLDKIEADPAFQKMMADSDQAIREGRVTPHEVVVKMALSKRKRRK